MVARPQQSRGGQPESLGKVRVGHRGAGRRLERGESQLGGGASRQGQVWKGLPRPALCSRGGGEPGPGPGDCGRGALPVHSLALLPGAPGPAVAPGPSRPAPAPQSPRPPLLRGAGRPPGGGSGAANNGRARPRAGGRRSRGTPAVRAARRGAAGAGGARAGGPGAGAAAPAGARGAGPGGRGGSAGRRAEAGAGSRGVAAGGGGGRAGSVLCSVCQCGSRLQRVAGEKVNRLGWGAREAPTSAPPAGEAEGAGEPAGPRRSPSGAAGSRPPLPRASPPSAVPLPPGGGKGRPGEPRRGRRNGGACVEGVGRHRWPEGRSREAGANGVPGWGGRAATRWGVLGGRGGPGGTHRKRGGRLGGSPGVGP